MKKTIILFLAVLGTITANAQQDKSKRPSPPAKVSETVSGGLKISIDYSQPAIKGRKLGTELAPFGKVWRTGANEATIFEISKDATINGKTLPAGKYSLYTIPGAYDWTLIFNKTWNQWGTMHKEADDALRVSTKSTTVDEFTERMTFKISDKGLVRLLWGNTEVSFTVK